MIGRAATWAAWWWTKLWAHRSEVRAGTSTSAETFALTSRWEAGWSFAAWAVTPLAITSLKDFVGKLALEVESAELLHHPFARLGEQAFLSGGVCLFDKVSLQFLLRDFTEWPTATASVWSISVFHDPTHYLPLLLPGSQLFELLAMLWREGGENLGQPFVAVFKKLSPNLLGQVLVALAVALASAFTPTVSATFCTWLSSRFSTGPRWKFTEQLFADIGQRTL
jgi:hypothetical protein